MAKDRKDVARRPGNQPTPPQGAPVVQGGRVQSTPAQGTPAQGAAAKGSASLSAFAGPLPPPQILAGYESVLPGSADRIMRWTEDESDHRRGMQRSDQNWAHWLDLAGLVVGAALAAMVIWVAYTLLQSGKTLEGLSTLVGTGLVALVIAFRRKRPRSSEGE